MGGGTIFKAVTKRDLTSLRLLKPPVPQVERYEAIARPIWDLLSNLSRQVDVLRQTRDLLLPKLVSGEIDVREFSDELEEAIA